MTVFVGAMGLGGRDEAGNRIWMVPPMPFESRQIPNDISQGILEDQQFSSFLSIAQFSGATGPIQRIERGGDPPDLLVTIQGAPPVAVELTTLSVTDVSRQRLDELRKYARSLNERIAADPERYARLRGRTISIAEHASDDARPKKRNAQQRAALVDQLAERLQRDFGVADEWASAEHIPAEVARQGRERVEEYEIAVHRSPAPEAPPTVTANVQVEISAADLRERLLSRIEAKDKPENDIVLISTGLIDKNGYVQAADHFVFKLINQLATEGLSFAPRHVNQVIVHHWRSGNISVLYQRPDASTLVNTSTSTWIRTDQ